MKGNQTTALSAVDEGVVLKTKLLVSLAAGVVLGLLALAGWTVTGIAFPQPPNSTEHLKFTGFVFLPKGSRRSLFPSLSVMDYMTVQDRNLYVASIKPGTVFKVPLVGGTLPTENEIVAFEGQPAAHGVVFDPASHLGFVSRTTTNQVEIFDPVGMQRIKSIPVDGGADGIFFDPINKLVYAASGEFPRATLIEPASLSVVGYIALAGLPEFAVFDPSTSLMYQNLTDISSLAGIDLAKRLVVERWQLADCQGPSGIALDAVNRRLFIACQRNATLVVFDMNRHQIVSRIETGGGPDSVAYDAKLHRIYVTGRTGVLTVIQQEDASTYRATDRITLAYGAHTLAFDPVTHRVYVGYVHLGGNARLAVFDAVR